MDQMVIDLGALTPEEAAAFKGAEAVMLGDGANGGPTADDWAAAAGTNNYEIVTRISPRVPRTYLNEVSAQAEAHKAAGHATEAAAL